MVEKKNQKEYSSFYNQAEKGWIFKKVFYKALIEKIKKFFPAILVNEIPEITFKALEPISSQITFKYEQHSYAISYSVFDRQKNVQDLPKHLYERLYRFQEEGIQFAVKNCARILIADEMGVGKTIQAISLAYLYRDSWPLLIISPSSLILNWKDEIKKWLNKSIKNSEIQIIQKSNVEIRPDAHIIIISYDLCSKLDKELDAKKFGVAIADEAHYMKNSLAKRTECITPILQKIKHVLLLTGTPALAKPKELFTLLHILRPDIFKFFKDFGNRFCDPKPSKWTKGLDYDGASNVRELYFLLNENLMIRRLKRDVLSELPSKRRQKVEINVDAKISSEIQKLLSKNSGIDAFLDEIMDASQAKFFENDFNPDDQNFDAMFRTKQQINETLNKCYLLTGLAKIKGINQYIADITENECKFLIFGHHMEVLDGIESQLIALKLKYIRIDGSVSMNKRHDLVQQFQEVPQIRIALLSISATGIGLTLTAASTILFTEMHWTPAMMLQAEDRAHRIGQINSVNCHYLYGSGTLDDRLYLKLDQKLGIVSEMIDGLRKDLEVEKDLKKGDMGAVSMEMKFEKKTQKRSSSAFYGKSDYTEEKDSKDKEKITNFFQIVGKKSSDFGSINKKNENKGYENKNSVGKEFNTISSIQKENYSVSSELPDLELLDKLVEEFNTSQKKKERNGFVEEDIKEIKTNEKNVNEENKTNEKNVKEKFKTNEKNVKEIKTNEKTNQEKKEKNLTIEKFRAVFKKEFKNNLIEGAEFVIESQENSRKLGENSNQSVILLDFDRKNEKKPFETLENLGEEEKSENFKRKRKENQSLQNIYKNEKLSQNLQKFKE